MWFTSDNAGPVHPKVMEALNRANEGYAKSYGADEIMDRVRARIRDLFEAPEAAVYLVATGTAANSLALACFCQPWGTIYSHRMAHIEIDECGAPEFFTNGAKLTLLDGAHAKIDPAELAKAVAFNADHDVHHAQLGVLSLSTVSEMGAVYTLDEIRALTAITKAAGVPVHLDGARFTNALVALDCTPAEMTWKSGIDVVSFGGTKNGLMGVEAVIIFDPAKAWEFELRRKRGGHLFSKHRYLSAQMEAYLTDDLWRDTARASNVMGQRLSEGLRQGNQVSILHPTDANMVFAGFPRMAHLRAFDAGAHYYFWPGDFPLQGPDDEQLSARLVCNWATTAEDVDRLVQLVQGH